MYIVMHAPLTFFFCSTQEFRLAEGAISEDCVPMSVFRPGEHLKRKFLSGCTRITCGTQTLPPPYKRNARRGFKTMKRQSFSPRFRVTRTMVQQMSFWLLPILAPISQKTPLPRTSSRKHPFSIYRKSSKNWKRKNPSLRDYYFLLPQTVDLTAHSPCVWTIEKRSRILREYQHAENLFLPLCSKTKVF